MAWSTPSGVNHSRRIPRVPRTWPVMEAIIPNRWATGRARSDTEPWVIPVASATVIAFHRRFS